MFGRGVSGACPAASGSAGGGSSGGVRGLAGACPAAAEAVGSVPAGRRIRRGGLAVEVYSDRRYMIVGDRVSGTPLELAVLPDAAGLIASL